MRKPARVLGYARVSSVEQALGTSLQDQQDVLRAHAKKGGLSVHRMYVEAESAVRERIEHREQMRALLHDARAGDLVLVDKLDRWSRDAEFTYRSIREILERGASFYAVGDACDPSTPDGDTMLSVRILVAREEHKRIKLRMVGTRKLLRDRGYYVEGLPPWGYRRQVAKGLERNVLVVDPVEAARVRDAFRLCVRGCSLEQIATELGELKDRVADALRSRVYLGEVRDSRGSWIAGKQPAIVTARLFADAGAALDDRRLGQRGPRAGAETDAWWLRTVARCGRCDGRMSAAYAGPKGIGRRHYFVCARGCPGSRYVAVRGAEAAVEPLVLEQLERLREALADSGAAVQRPRGDARAEAEAARAKLALRRERLLEQNADGHIDREELRERMARLDVQRTRLDAAAYEPPPVDPRERRKRLRELGAVTRAWGRAGPAERRRIVADLARAVFLAAGEPPRVEWYSAEDLAQRG